MRVGTLLGFDIAAEIGHELIIIAVCLQYIAVTPRLFGRECAGSNLFDYAVQTAVGFEIADGVLTFAADGFHLFYGVAENKDIVFTHMLENLHIGTVKRADGQCAVERKLHIARTRSLRTGQ